jgi:hypothetical protein
MAITYHAGRRIQGLASTGAVDTLGTSVNGTNSGTTTDSNTPFYGDTSVAFSNNNAVHDLGTTSSFAGLIEEDFTVIFWAKASAVGNGGAGSNSGWGSGTSSNTYAGNQGTVLNCGQVSGNGSTQGFVISFDDEGTEEFYMWMGDGNGNNILNDVIGSNNVADTDNNWHIYMFHFDNTNSEVRIYRDGGSSVIQTTSYSSQVSSTSATTYKKLFMGRQSDDDGRYFIGSLADVSIWKRLLTTAEFTQLWGTFVDNTSTATSSVKGVRVDALTNQTGLLAHWKLDDLNFTNSAEITPEKSTITNAQVGSRFEETDTRKMYNFTDLPTIEDDFSSSSGWTQVTNTASGVSGGELIGLTNSSGTNGAGVWKDYGLVSDEKFILRCKFQIVTQSGGAGNASTLYFGISDTNAATSPHSNRDGFGIAITNYAGSGMLWLYPDGTTWDNADTDMSLTPTETTYYLEIARTSATSVTFKLFSDEYSTVVKTHTQTIASTLNGLRYIMFQEWRNGSSNTTKVAVDDLKIYNNVSSASELYWKEIGT